MMFAGLFLEEIFDAVDDDAQFQQLSTKLARTLGARSGVLHWSLPDDDEEQEISYSGHFSLEDMARFEGDFARDDLWAAAIGRPAAQNRAWNLETLVPRAHYERSRIYNEWIRAIGDDTIHALGAAIRTPEICIDIAVHRGRAQRPFDAEALAKLSRCLSPIQRMILVRRKLRASRNDAAASALDQVGHASFTLAPNGRVLHLNRLAQAVVDGGELFRVRHGRLHAVTAADESKLSDAIASATTPKPESAALLLGGKDGRGRSAMLMPVWSGGGRQLVLVVSDAAQRRPGIEHNLRVLYGLSQAEAGIATLLADGLSPTEVAEQRATSIGTIRVQIKSIAAKMDVSRQSEIVRAVLNLPRLAP